MIDQFKEDVKKGLESVPKRLPSKYFYDKIGDELFIRIMNLSEYYLTRSELEIFKTQAKDIIEKFDIDKTDYFELIELGAGDGLKTKELLKVLLAEGYSFTYVPIDISQNALDGLETSLKLEIPQLAVKKQQGDYFDVLESFKKNKNSKVILFLGSNIGNLLDHEASDFIYKLGSNVQSNDKILLGVDLIKSKDIVLPAYNDSEGVTSSFNLNLLNRINKELGANFDVSKFKHSPEYEESEGVAKSFLMSKENQSIYIKKLDKNYHFSEGEKIQTEVSRKYNTEVLERILVKTDFRFTHKFVDSNAYFADYLLCKE